MGEGWTGGGRGEGWRWVGLKIVKEVVRISRGSEVGGW